MRAVTKVERLDQAFFGLDMARTGASCIFWTRRCIFWGKQTQITTYVQSEITFEKTSLQICTCLKAQHNFKLNPKVTIKSNFL